MAASPGASGKACRHPSPIRTSPLMNRRDQMPSSAPSLSLVTAQVNQLVPADLLSLKEYLEKRLTNGKARAAGQQTSPLLRMPQEIQDAILELVLPTDQLLVVQFLARQSGPFPYLRTMIPILQTCSKLRYAGAKIFYGRNTFGMVPEPKPLVCKFATFLLAVVGPHKQHIRSIKAYGECLSTLFCNCAYQESEEKDASKLDSAYGFRPGTFWVRPCFYPKRDWMNANGETLPGDDPDYCDLFGALLPDSVYS